MPSPGRRRHRHPLRALRRVSRLQWLIALGMVAAAVAASVSLTLILRGPAPPPAYAAATPSTSAASSAPLELPSGSASVPASPATAANSGDVTVRLIIPAGGIDIAVIQGDGVTVPLHFALHYPGTAWPGQGSNSVFYAHGQAGMFLGLYSLHMGDQVEAVRANGSVLDYRVSGFEDVAWNDLAVLDSTSFDEMTLLTCTSYNPYTDRFIVLATLV